MGATGVLPHPPGVTTYSRCASSRARGPSPIRRRPTSPMKPRLSDYLGAAILAIVLFALVAVIVFGNSPAAEA